MEMKVLIFRGLYGLRMFPSEDLSYLNGKRLTVFPQKGFGWSGG